MSTSTPEAKIEYLCNAVKDILAEKCQSLSFVTLHNSSYSLSQNERYASVLHERINNTIGEHVLMYYQELLENFNGIHDVVQIYAKYETPTRIRIPCVMSQLDENYCKRHGKPTIEKLGLLAFADKLLCQDGIQLKLQNLLWSAVSNSRAGKPIDALSMKKMLALLLKIRSAHESKRSFYSVYFEDRVLEEARSYHSPFILEWQNDSCLEYLRKAHHNIQSEMEHTFGYLPEESRIRLKLEIEDTLLNPPALGHLTGLLKKTQGFEEQLRATSIESPESTKEPVNALEFIYSVVQCREDALPILCGIVRETMTSEAQVIISDEEYATNKKSYIGKLIQLKEKYEHIVKKSFQSNDTFDKTVSETFAEIIKSYPCEQMAQSLVVYFALIIKSSEGTEEELKKAVFIIDYLTEKDLFEHYHRKQMKRRLLLNSKSSEHSIELEACLLNMLKHHIDTMTLEHLLSDYKKALAESTVFNEYLQGKELKLPISFSVLTLNTARWVTEPLNAIFPPIMEQCMKLYTDWYNSVHNGRKIQWIPSGSVDIRYRVGTKNFTLNLESTIQAILILQFGDDNQTLTAQQISNDTLIPEKEVTRFLTPFAAKQIGILKLNKGEYSLEPKFTSKRTVIKIPLGGGRAQAKSDTDQTNQEVAKQREYIIQSAIVRVMKKSKSLELSQLTSAVIELVQKTFKPDIKSIKLQIERLIDGEYLERDPEQPKIFNYRA